MSQLSSSLVNVLTFTFTCTVQGQQFFFFLTDMDLSISSVVLACLSPHKLWEQTLLTSACPAAFVVQIDSWIQDLNQGSYRWSLLPLFTMAHPLSQDDGNSSYSGKFPIFLTEYQIKVGG